MSKKRYFLPYELDAFGNAPVIGVACGTTAAAIVYGNLLMWQHVWKTKSDLVTTAHVVAFFGVNACEALMLFGHLEASGSGWRVRGAAEWLRVMCAQSEAGKAKAGNLKQGQTIPGSIPAPTPKKAEAGDKPAGSLPALSATSDQRPATIQKEDLPHPLQALWNLTVPPRSRCPKWTKTKGARKTRADARLEEHPDLSWWQALFDGVVASDFLSGRKTDFAAYPDWIINPTNLLKVVEGTYSRNDTPLKSPNADLGIIPSRQGYVRPAPHKPVEVSPEMEIPL